MHGMRNRLTYLAVTAALFAGPPSSALDASGSPGRHWTLEDIVLAPEVTGIALSQDQRTALYVLRTADIEADRPRSLLRLVNLATGAQQDLLRTGRIERLRRIPQSDDWSALLDVGDGQQLYRIERSGKIRPLIIHPATMLVGEADMAVTPSDMSPPHQVGVRTYDWSPDGKWLWYSLLKPGAEAGRVRFDKEVTSERDRRRPRPEAVVEFHLRGPGDQDSMVMTRPASDRMALHYGEDIVWQDDDILFRVEIGDGTTGSTFETRAWNRTKKTMTVLAKERDIASSSLLRGPRGGQLATSGVGDQYDLVETFADGRRYDYGPVGFAIGHPRSAGDRRAADGKSVVLGTRGIANQRYGLAVIEADRVRTIASDASLTRCDFSNDLAVGLCVREAMTQPPELVRVDLKTGKIEHVAPISPRHEEIAPLAIAPRTWVNRLGYKATGFVVLPRGYVAGRRYPGIIVTHASDADDRFIGKDLQWSYPVQLFAERGYVVMLINDPAPRQNARILAVYQAWMRGSGPPGPEEVQQLGWVNGVYSFEDAVKELAAEGLVDPERVGIAGYSRGSQMVNVTLTHSKMFRAASGGDGSYLEPWAYPITELGYDAIFGGSPFGEHIEHYRRFSPSLNGDKVCGALLQQVATPIDGALAMYEALRAHRVPTQLSYYPGESAASDETHIFHIPSNRLNAMRENLAWFDYWLLNRRDPGAPFPQRLEQWDQMARDPKRACTPPAPQQAGLLHQRAQLSAAPSARIRWMRSVPRRLGSSASSSNAGSRRPAAAR